MHLSKRTLYVGIIAYCVGILVFQDWAAMIAHSGNADLFFIGKFIVDGAFIAAAVLRLAGPALFAEDEADDEVAIHEEDLHVSDTSLFGLFLLYVVSNFGWHIYQETQTTDAGAGFYYSLWIIIEAVTAVLSWVLWSHAVKTQRRLARKGKGAQPTSFRQAS